MVLRSALPYAVVSRSQTNKEAFVEGTKFLVQNMLESFSKRMEIQLLYGQAGLAKVQSVSGNTITIQTAEWAPGIWAGSENAPLEIRQADGTIRGECTVSSVSLSNRTVTVNLAPIATASGDVLWYKGAYSNEFQGMYSIITATGSLFGINTQTYNLFSGNSVGATGALNFATIETAIGKAVEKGLAHKVMVLVNVNGWTDLLTEQAAKRVYDKSYSTDTMENGARALKFFGQNGEIEIRPSIYVKEGHCFVMSMDELERIGSSDITFRRPGRGDEFFRELEGSAGWELRAYCDQALFCYRPGLSTLITGVVN